MKKFCILTAVVSVFFVFNTAHADRTVWYVHPDSALNSIQAGLDSCAVNDIVLVGQGTYVENIVWPNTQGIHLISEMVPEITIIDGSIPSNPDSGSVIAFVSGQDTNTVVYGFTITNGSGTYQSGWGRVGGGIFCSNSSPTITNNIIQMNSANWAGGIECENNSNPIISNNTITGNTAIGAGGGIECYSTASPRIQGNTITGNSANGGGGISCDDLTQPIIIGNTISGNTAGNGGGIGCFNNASPTIIGDTIIENTGDGIFSNVSLPTIDSCVISNNTGHGIYSSGTGSSPRIKNCNITDGYGVMQTNTIWLDAEYNWWGDASGPYHPDSNPGGLGDTVSDYVDFIPWLDEPVGVWEQPIVKPVKQHETIGSTIFSGPLLLPEGKNCKVFDITGRVVMPDKIKPGIYFIEIDGKITQKVVKVR